MPDLNTTSDVVCAARHEGQALILTIQGDIDLHNSPGLRTDLLDLLAKTKPTKLVLNLQGVQYMDSSAVAVLVEALQKLRKASGKVFLCGLQPRVKGLLEIARLDTIFVVVNAEADALAKP